ncbi:MAG: 5'-nucleotidase, lipoprotein e(P4) family [Bacteroidota bacterium]
MRHHKIFLLSFIFIASCQTSKKTTKENTQPSSMMFGAKLYTAFYQQQAAEYKALCFQSYMLAKSALDAAMVNGTSLPAAIVTDIDETVLDNSMYAVKRALEEKEYSLESWHDWTGRSLADTLAGALTFFNYAKSRGAEIYYISNRDETERDGTLKNLQKFGFPDSDNEHLLLKQGTSSKEPRRLQVAEKHSIVLYIGDNLADFNILFDKKTTEERNQNMMKLHAAFGYQYIILPNPFYGDWEGSTFKYNYGLTPAQKDSVIRTVLHSY